MANVNVHFSSQILDCPIEDFKMLSIKKGGGGGSNVKLDFDIAVDQ